MSQWKSDQWKYIRIVGHRLQHSIVEFDGARDEQGVVRGLSRHGGFRGIRGGIWDGAIEGFIFGVVRG
jgi:hypothetical protein